MQNISKRNLLKIITRNINSTYENTVYEWRSTSSDQTTTKQQNAGRDNIKAKQIKYVTEDIATEFETTYSKIATNGKHPNEINRGVLTVIQKLGKPKGLIENLRPITLLFILKKSLAIG